MGHYAFLDENNIVTEVITGRDENEVVEGISDWEAYYGEFRGQVCKRTSYNTYHNQHKTGGTPFRKNYAGVGYTYDEENDAFISSKPYASWILDTEIFDWVSPVPMPTDGKLYIWNEETVSWEEVTD